VLAFKIPDQRKETCDEYLGGGFLDLPIDPPKANKLRRSGDLLVSILFCRLLDRERVTGLSEDCCTLGCGEGVGGKCSFEFLMVADSNLVNNPDSELNMRRRLLIEDAVSFCVESIHLWNKRWIEPKTRTSLTTARSSSVSSGISPVTIFEGTRLLSLGDNIK
jgi:hypothetical protein